RGRVRGRGENLLARPVGTIAERPVVVQRGGWGGGRFQGRRDGPADRTGTAGDQSRLHVTEDDFPAVVLAAHVAESHRTLLSATVNATARAPHFCPRRRRVFSPPPRSCRLTQQSAGGAGGPNGELSRRPPLRASLRRLAS